jgi:hypothetical protein
MLDTHRLAKLVYVDSKNVQHFLSPDYSKKAGLLCDENGYVNGPKIRRLYMMAGLISPADDNSETLIQSIKSNIMLLNEFHALHYGVEKPKRVTKPVLPTKKTVLPKKLNK